MNMSKSARTLTFYKSGQTTLHCIEVHSLFVFFTVINATLLRFKNLGGSTKQNSIDDLQFKHIPVQDARVWQISLKETVSILGKGKKKNI